VPQPSLGVAFPPPSVLVSLPLELAPPALDVVTVAVVTPPVVTLELVLLLLLADDTLLAEPVVAFVVAVSVVVTLAVAVWVVVALLLVVVVGPDELVTVIVAFVVPVSLGGDAGSESLHAGSAAKSAPATNCRVRGWGRVERVVADCKRVRRMNQWSIEALGMV